MKSFLGRRLLDVIALLVFTALWVVFTLGSVAWIEHLPVTNPQMALQKTAHEWGVLVLFGYGWLMTIGAAVAWGPRRLLWEFIERLTASRW